MENKFFPVSIDLNNKNILVIGAGKIAFRKVETLLKYNCNIKVITKEVENKNFFNFTNERISIESNKEFSESDLENVFLVVAATSNEEVNKKIADLCIQKNILVNNISSKNDMNLRFTSIYETEDLQISVSANANPKKSVEIKNKIKDFFEMKK